MAYTYLFFEPASLSVNAEDLGEDTIRPIQAGEKLRALPGHACPGLQWSSEYEAKVDLDQRWVEFHLGRGEGTLSLPCSLRADHSDIVQRLCDELGWIAFDEQSLCYQPHRAPFPA